jgi:hypothetical protein
MAKGMENAILPRRHGAIAGLSWVGEGAIA